MCGRLNVISDPLNRIVSEMLGLAFRAESHPDLRPTQKVATVEWNRGEIRQSNLVWGIRPEWANQLIINAKAETVSVKPTFIHGFEHHRVLVPCSGWYEWRTEDGRKRRYLFRPRGNEVLFMAGIGLSNSTRLVTLTARANAECAEYHPRMPLLIEPDRIMSWLSAPQVTVFPLLTHSYEGLLTIESVESFQDLPKMNSAQR